MEYNKELLSLAKRLKELAPDGCITTISINKAVHGYDAMPQLYISHYDGEGGCYKLLDRETNVMQGIDVVTTYFEGVENDD